MSIRAFYLPVVALLTLLVIASPARAQTPESGIWWNPNEPGTGLILDLQDDFLAVSLFVGDTVGNPEWYTSTGFLSGADGRSVYQGNLDFFPGAQCIGCGFRATRPQFGVGGPIRIVFSVDDSARATLTLGGRTTQIERFRFYFKRPEDEQRLPGVSADLTRLMGEWSAVLDYSDTPSFGAATYLGEVLIFDRLVSDGVDLVRGCRPPDSQVGFCSTVDRAERFADAEYLAANDLHLILVDNDSATFALYEVFLDTNEFRGEVAVYQRGGDPTADDFVPVRGFRSASRTFVQEGTGPSRKAAAASVGLPLTQGSTSPVRKVARSKEQQDELNAARQRLESRLLQRRAAEQNN